MELGAALVFGWLEDQLREVIERLLPMPEVVGVFIHVPEVRDVFSFR